MKYMFSGAGDAALAATVRRGSLVGLDFDGTLSPIVPLPEDAHLTQSMLRALASVNQVCKVAIVSGREVADVKRRVPVAPAYLLGNHGMEGLPGTQAMCVEAKRLADGWVTQLCSPDGDPLGSGVFVEHKAFSLAIHFRLCTDRPAARHRIEARLDALTPRPRVILGHCVYNLLHPCAPDKGVAFRGLFALSGCDNAVFIGDDEADELVFRHAPPDWLTVRVGYSMNSAARFFLQQQAEVGMLLEEIALRGRASGLRAGATAS